MISLLRWVYLMFDTDIDECQLPNTCYGRCRNKPGSFECWCPKGHSSADPFKERCTPNFPLPAQIVVGMCEYSISSSTWYNNAVNISFIYFGKFEWVFNSLKYIQNYYVKILINLTVHDCVNFLYLSCIHY